MMTDTRSLNVNILPCPTWNKLSVNRATVDISSFSKEKEKPQFTLNNLGPVRRTKIRAVEAEKYADSLSDGIRREAYIAGKRAIYQEQHFQTGLGRELTDFLLENVDEAEIYTVPEAAEVYAPVILKWEFGKTGHSASMQVIHALKDSHSTFLIFTKSEKEASGELMMETKVILEEGATVNLIKVNLLGDGITVLNDTGALLRDNATFNFTQMVLGGNKNYVGCFADQCGDNTIFNINAGYLVNKDHLLDINYHGAMRGKNSDAKIFVKGSLSDSARKVFRGTIDFRKGSKGSKGDEQEDVLLLTPGVINKTVPVILTEEEDVDGRHGATVGNLLPDMLYYLGTRGIDSKAAEMLITRGRLLSIANTIPDDETVNFINLFIREAFEVNECF
jgi:Fe-S cluster assembly scaffold protein SufB